jgi:hypothetical protein
VTAILARRRPPCARSVRGNDPQQRYRQERTSAIGPGEDADQGARQGVSLVRRSGRSARVFTDTDTTRQAAMSTTEIRSDDAPSNASAGKVDMKLEAVVIPVSDVDRAAEFYGRLGWRLDADIANGDSRRLQFTPPGSRARSFSARASPRLHPERRSNASFVTFSDPDGNGWLLQEITTRFPGRIDSDVTSSRPQRRWRARCGVRRPPTASTRSAPGSATRTGPTGTPSTWWRSTPGRSCRRERRRDSSSAADRRTSTVPGRSPKVAWVSRSSSASWSVASARTGRARDDRRRRGLGRSRGRCGTLRCGRPCRRAAPRAAGPHHGCALPVTGPGAAA